MYTTGGTGSGGSTQQTAPMAQLLALQLLLAALQAGGPHLMQVASIRNLLADDGIRLLLQCARTSTPATVSAAVAAATPGAGATAKGSLRSHFFFESVYLVIHVSDCIDQQSTLVLQTVLSSCTCSDRSRPHALG